MSYSDFKTIDEVIDKFGIKVLSKPFVDRLVIEIENYPFSKIEGKLQDEMSFVSVTTGDIWMFGQLESGQSFTRDTRKISATTDLQWVFDTLNWMFSKANEQVIN